MTVNTPYPFPFPYITANKAKHAGLRNHFNAIRKPGKLAIRAENETITCKNMLDIKA